MTATASQLQTPHPKIWTKAEFLRIVELGGFDEDSHTYLFRGELLTMAPMGPSHHTSIMKTTSVLSRLCNPRGFLLRVQLPFSTPGDSIPEPDFAICTEATAFEKPYPIKAELIIEVAESSLNHDRQKALEYAAAGVREYWIVDLNRRCVEVYRNPSPDSTAMLGYRYAPPTIAKEGDVVTPIAVSDAALKVNDLLP